MNHYYVGESQWMYRSRVDSEKLFATIDEARAFDTTLAFEILQETRLDRLHEAFERRDDKLARALKFLAEETDVMPDLRAAKAAA